MFESCWQEVEIFYSNKKINKSNYNQTLFYRLGKALRDLVKDKRKQGVTLGGKGHGTLTEAKIKKLQKYHQNAILKHKNDVPAMKNAILATLYHAVSTDTKPQHQLCPKGGTSWCFYQAALSQNRKPESHTKCVGTAIKPEFLKFLLPIYERLTSEDLLRRCTGLTQNANESLHSVIWKKCSKNSAPTISRVQLAVAQGICEFNRSTLQRNYWKLLDFFQVIILRLLQTDSILRE